MLHSMTVLPLSYGPHATQSLKVSTSVIVNMYELLSLFGKRVPSLKLTSSWPSLVMTLYVMTTANSSPQAMYTLMAGQP